MLCLRACVCVPERAYKNCFFFFNRLTYQFLPFHLISHFSLFLDIHIIRAGKNSVHQKMKKKKFFCLFVLVVNYSKKTTTTTAICIVQTEHTKQKKTNSFTHSLNSHCTSTTTLRACFVLCFLFVFLFHLLYSSYFSSSFSSLKTKTKQKKKKDQSIYIIMRWICFFFCFWLDLIINKTKKKQNAYWKVNKKKRRRKKKKSIKKIKINRFHVWLKTIKTH